MNHRPCHLAELDAERSGITRDVPKVRTLRHYRPYDEMMCVVQGRGTVEIEFLVELGVFTPAGSPTQNTPRRMIAHSRRKPCLC